MADSNTCKHQWCEREIHILFLFRTVLHSGFCTALVFCLAGALCLFGFAPQYSFGIGYTLF